MELFINISISLIAGGSAGCGLFYCLGKKWIANWFAKDLKEYEHKLSLLKMKNEIQFSNVYTKQAEIIAEVYKYLAHLDILQTCLNNQEIESNDIQEKFLKLYEEFGIYASKNGIYFSEDIRNKLNNLIDAIGKPFLIKVIEMNSENLNIKEDTKNIIKNIPDGDIKSTIKELVKEFQKLLGIEEEK